MAGISTFEKARQFLWKHYRHKDPRVTLVLEFDGHVKRTQIKQSSFSRYEKQGFVSVEHPDTRQVTPVPLTDNHLRAVYVGNHLVAENENFVPKNRPTEKLVMESKGVSRKLLTEAKKAHGEHYLCHLVAEGLITHEQALMEADAVIELPAEDQEDAVDSCEIKQLFRLSEKNAKIPHPIFAMRAGYTCPFAKKCFSRAVVDKETGKAKVKDGPDTEFRCYAASQEAQYPNVRAVREHNEALARMMVKEGGAKAFADRMIDTFDVNPFVRRNSVFRIHESGDFFNQEYLEGWAEVARREPGILFYAYTKSFPFAQAVSAPDNLKIIHSLGGRHDDEVIRSGEQFAAVISSLEDWEKVDEGSNTVKGWTYTFSDGSTKEFDLPLDWDDSNAYKYDKPFALAVHGTQPKGSEAGKTKSAVTKSELFKAKKAKKKAPPKQKLLTMNSVERGISQEQMWEAFGDKLKALGQATSEFTKAMAAVEKLYALADKSEFSHSQKEEIKSHLGAVEELFGLYGGMEAMIREGCDCPQEDLDIMEASSLAEITIEQELLALQDVINGYASREAAIAANGPLNDLWNILLPDKDVKEAEEAEWPLEGPFVFPNGREVYYDRVEGKYYDRAMDLYLSDEEVLEMMRMSEAFKSDAQRRYFYHMAGKPGVEGEKWAKLAKQFEKETPKGADLPEKLGEAEDTASADSVVREWWTRHPEDVIAVHAVGYFILGWREDNLFHKNGFYNLGHTNDKSLDEKMYLFANELLFSMEDSIEGAIVEEDFEWLHEELGVPLAAEFQSLEGLEEERKLPAYKVYLDNGDHYVTSMAAGVTLEDAQEYFLGQSFEQPDGSMAKAIKVEEVGSGSFSEALEKDTEVRVPHNGRMVSGKVVRYDKGEKHGSPFYVVYIGEPRSLKVPVHKVVVAESAASFKQWMSNAAERLGLYTDDDILSVASSDWWKAQYKGGADSIDAVRDALDVPRNLGLESEAKMEGTYGNSSWEIGSGISVMNYRDEAYDDLVVSSELDIRGYHHFPELLVHDGKAAISPFGQGDRLTAVKEGDHFYVLGVNSRHDYAALLALDSDMEVVGDVFMHDEDIPPIMGCHDPESPCWERASSKFFDLPDGMQIELLSNYLPY